MLLLLRATRGGTAARAFFPVATLAALGRPTTQATPFSAALDLNGDTLPVVSMSDVGALDRLETLTTELGIAGLTLKTSTRSAPISSSLIVALLLPLLMWIAGAGVSWLVVDRLLVRPLRRLRTSVAAFTPGEVIDTGSAGTLPAAEIRELGDTFRAISRTVAIHEAGLADGLVRQTKLTREVHHRVKNNLQVISSLINFHARGAPSGDAIAAYASIQRRVDALAVVHRNHFAENEETRGLNLRTMLGELTANIRATAPDDSRLGITLEVEPFMVNQDVAVAIAFLITEMVELAMNCDGAAQIRVAVRAADSPQRAIVRVVSRALIEGDRSARIAANSLRSHHRGALAPTPRAAAPRSTGRCLRDRDRGDGPPLKLFRARPKKGRNPQAAPPLSSSDSDLIAPRSRYSRHRPGSVSPSPSEALPGLILGLHLVTAATFQRDTSSAAPLGLLDDVRGIGPLTAALGEPDRDQRQLVQRA